MTPSKLRLLDLPFIPMQKIMRSLSLLDLLAMAETSSKAQCMIKTMSFDKLRLDLSVNVCALYQSIYGDIGTQSILGNHLTLKSSNKKWRSEYEALPDIKMCGRVVKRRNDFWDRPRRNRSGRLIENVTCLVKQDPSHTKPTVLEMMDYISTLLNIELDKFSAVVSDELSSDDPFLEHILTWPRAKLARNVVLGGKGSASLVSSFCESQRVLDMFSFSNYNKELVHLDNVPVATYSVNLSDISISHNLLKSIRSPVIRIHRHDATEEHIIRFIEDWLSGTDCHFHVLGVEMSPPTFDFNTVLAHFEEHSHEWDRKERAQFFIDKGAHVDCRLARDLKRADGELASIAMVDNEFWFFVWKERFPEFREYFKRFPLCVLY